MKFSTNEDLAMPSDAAFALLSDFAAFERAVLRRGAQVTRTDSLSKPGVGMSWDASFKLRGKPREISAKMTSYTPTDGYALDAVSGNLEGAIQLELISLSKSRTRMSISVEIKPRSLSGRLMIQTLKLGKAKLTRSFKHRVADYARVLETRHTARRQA